MPFKLNAITGKLDLVDVASIPPTVAEDFVTDSGTAVAAGSILNVLGGAGIDTSGSGNTVTYTVSAAVPLTFPTDSGTATPAANLLNVLGGTGISTSGAGDTVTITLDTPVIVANGGTNQTIYTTGDILYASASNTLSKLSAGSDTEVLTLAAGVPSWVAHTEGTEFIDNVFRVLNVSDDTKEIALDASAITTANTRTITMVDADIDLANVVQASSALTDNAILRGDGGVKGSQTSTAIIDDNGNATFTRGTGGELNLSARQTGTASGDTVRINVGVVAGSGEDAYFHLAREATTNYSFGIDNSDDDRLKITTNAAAVTPSTGSTLFNMSVNGELNLPLQPAFSAYVSGQKNNVTGDGTVYTTIFNAELFDQNADFNTTTGVFTAPVTGRYYFNTNIALTGLLSGHTSGRVNIVTTGQTCTIWDGNPYALSDSSGEICISGGIFINMSASWTASVTVTVSGSTKVVDVREFFTMGSNFQGWLVC